MQGYQKTIIIGNLTKDPELRATSAGVAVCSFTIACNMRYAAGKEDSFFIDVTAWDKLAEICGSRITKGEQVLVEGRLINDKWETRDGQKRTKIKLVANRVQFMTPKRQEDQGENEDGPVEPYSGI